MLQDRRAGCQQTCTLLTLIAVAFIYLIFHLCILCHYSTKPQWNDWTWNMKWYQWERSYLNGFVPFINHICVCDFWHRWKRACSFQRKRFKQREEQTVRRAAEGFFYPTNKIINSCQRRETRQSGAARVVSGVFSLCEAERRMSPLIRVWWWVGVKEGGTTEVL